MAPRICTPFVTYPILDAALPFTIRQTVIKPEQAACLAAWKCLKQDRIHQCSSVEALQPGGSSQIPYDLPDQFGPAGAGRDADILSRSTYAIEYRLNITVTESDRFDIASRAGRQEIDASKLP